VRNYSPFGWGDGGGGPTRDHLEFLRREENLEGVPRARLDSLLALFENQIERGWPAQRYVGELYFPVAVYANDAVHEIQFGHYAWHPYYTGYAEQFVADVLSVLAEYVV
jgi:hypothetical protein